MTLIRDSLLTPQCVADEVLKVFEKTLANWRSAGNRPPFTNVGKRILYPSNLLSEWLNRNTRTTLPIRERNGDWHYRVLGEREGVYRPNAIGRHRTQQDGRRGAKA